MVSSSSADSKPLSIGSDGTFSVHSHDVLVVGPGEHTHAEDLFRTIVTKNSERQGGPFVASQQCHRCMSVVVILFAICWGISTYFDRHTDLVAFITFFVLRILFLLVFMVELFLCLLAYRRITILCCFDSFLNLVGLADICLSSIIIASGSVGQFYQPHLALEVIQLFRLYRLLFIVKELQLFSTGLFHSLQSLRWAALFVVLVIYGSAIFTTWTFGDGLSIVDGEDEDDMYEMWGTLVNSLFTLFTVLTLEGWNDICSQTAKHHPYSKIFFVVYICFTTLTLMNVVTGVVLDAYVEMSQQMNAGKEYEKSLRNSKVMEELLQTAFVVNPPSFDECRNASAPSDLRLHSDFSPSASTMDSSPNGQRSLDLLSDSNDKADTDPPQLSTVDPQILLLRPDVSRALDAGNVPLYLAFDVLRTYYLHGRRTVTVSEFCDGCSRMGGQVTGRHLTHMEVSLKSQLNRIERNLRRLHTRHPNPPSSHLSLPPQGAC
eukprot:GHVS01032538.1.p1 GENE.GHVS01032538.1~~GHVS01032538.1.p1  ORF type:complete len:510 (-),score=50.17 GHVS01032538.1:417-1886(-)